MYTLSIQRWVGGRSWKVARRVALDQNGHSKTLHADPPTHRNNARLCNSHRCALFTTTISAVKPRPPAPDDRIFLLFLYKAAELKRFRSHPLSSAVNPGTSKKSETSDTEELDQLHGALLRPQKEAQVPRNQPWKSAHLPQTAQGPRSDEDRREVLETRVFVAKAPRGRRQKGMPSRHCDSLRARTWEQASSTELEHSREVVPRCAARRTPDSGAQGQDGWARCACCSMLAALWPVDPSARRHGRPMCVHVSPDKSEQPQRSCRSRRSTPSMGACGPKLTTPTEACPLGRCSSLVSCQAESCASLPPHADLHFLPLVTQQPYTAELSGRPEMLTATARVRHPSHVGVDRAADQDLRSEA